MISVLEKNRVRWLKRKRSIRKKVKGTPERPRLTIYRSLKHMYAQVIDDHSGKTLAAASTLEKEVQEQVKGKKKREAANVVGKIIAERCLKGNISKVVFDRNGYAFGGRVAQVAAAAREKGLVF